jgi:RNA recognition motif-containing protein
MLGITFGKRKDAMPKLFLGNIPHASTTAQIQQWVESRGFEVENVEIIYDKITGKSRGFGFVTLKDQTNLQNAISVMNGRRMDGRTLTVNEATPLTSRPERLSEQQASVHDPH